MRTRYYLDATAAPEMLALYRQIPVTQILQIEQKTPPLENLDFVWVTGFGLAGKNRSNSCDQRLKVLHAFLKEKHPNLVTFDWKAKRNILEVDGHYFSDSIRGTNEFINQTAIAAIDLPTPDVATFYDLWLTSKTNESLSFEDFYRYLVDAEIIQGVSRLRANRRPEEELTFYLIGDTEKSRVANYKPPQLKPRQVEVQHLCPLLLPSRSKHGWVSAKSLSTAGPRMGNYPLRKKYQNRLILIEVGYPIWQPSLLAGGSISKNHPVSSRPALQLLEPNGVSS
jgi:hypothetical protein